MPKSDQQQEGAQKRINRVLERLEERAEVFHISADVLAEAAMEAMINALEEEDCVTFPLRFRTVLPSEVPK